MITKTRQPFLTTRELTLLPLFTVLTAVGAFIKIPIGAVPVSLQTVFVLLSALLLGKKAAISQGLYVLLGLLGLPIFTGGGGIGYVLTPTFGYLMGFIAAAFIVGSLRDLTKKKDIFSLFLFSILGVIVIYTMGVTHLYLLSHLLTGGSRMPLGAAIKFGALVFLPMDLLWSFFGASLAARLLKNPGLRLS